MFFIKLLRDVLKILNTDASPTSLAFGAVFGVFMGLMPGIVPKCLIFLFIMVLRVNISSAFASAALFSIAGFALDPISDKVGYFILNIDFLLPFYTYLYNLPLLPFTNFYNTIAAGNFVFSIALSVPVYFAAIKIIDYYRTHLMKKVLKWRITKLLFAGSVSYKILK
ncbi:MAG: TIGR03546 family protein [Endomicrobium sp.]|jgi:uncharacterized protein (TIGR03546 family)|nr:TIGR03546 family protein [Endomicrobium sp.]